LAPTQRTGDDRLKPVLDVFKREHLRVYGRSYPCSYGRDAKIIKSIPKDYTVEDLVATIQAFFQNPDEWWIKHKGATVPVWYSRLSTLLPKKKSSSRIANRLTLPEKSLQQKL
jgi:hypothetical protein